MEALLPTESLYLIDALAESGRHSLRRVASHTFAADRLSIIVRYASREEWGALKNSPYVYLIDDDLPAIPEDDSLPGDYRNKMAAFLAGPWQQIVEGAALVVTSSPRLLQFYQALGKKTVLLAPYWRELSRPAAAPSRPPRRKLRVVWLASRSHQPDLDSIIAQVEPVFRKFRNATFTVCQGKHLSPSLRHFPNLINLSPLPWGKYRRWLARQTFDIALHPLRNTPVNQSRSLSKWGEIAVAGALPQIGNILPWTDLDSRFAPFLVSPDDWPQRLELLFACPEKRLEMSHQSAALAQEIHHKARQAQIEFWQTLLDVGVT